MRYIIIEDEKYSLDCLSIMIKKLRPEWELVFVSGSVSETRSFLRQRDPIDLCFIDIELEDESCFDIFKDMRPETPVIFTTAYDEYSLKAFKVNSIGYVLKPIDPNELLESIEKFELISGQRSNSYTNDIQPPAKTEATPLRNNERILTSTGNGYGFINIDDVAWLVSEDKYVFAVSFSGSRSLTVISTLNDAESILDNRRFHRISRNVICSVKAIAEIHRHLKGRLKINLRAGQRNEEVVISASRRQVFLRWLGVGNL